MSSFFSSFSFWKKKDKEASELASSEPKQKRSKLSKSKQPSSNQEFRTNYTPVPEKKEEIRAVAPVSSPVHANISSLDSPQTEVASYIPNEEITSFSPPKHSPIPIIIPETNNNIVQQTEIRPSSPPKEISIPEIQNDDIQITDESEGRSVPPAYINRPLPVPQGRPLPKPPGEPIRRGGLSPNYRSQGNAQPTIGVRPRGGPPPRPKYLRGIGARKVPTPNDNTRDISVSSAVPPTVMKDSPKPSYAVVPPSVSPSIPSYAQYPDSKDESNNSGFELEKDNLQEFNDDTFENNKNLDETEGTSSFLGKVPNREIPKVPTKTEKEEEYIPLTKSEEPIIPSYVSEEPKEDIKQSIPLEKDEKEEPELPIPPPRSPESKRRTTPPSPIPELPWREPLPSLIPPMVKQPSETKESPLPKESSRTPVKKEEKTSHSNNGSRTRKKKGSHKDEKGRQSRPKKGSKIKSIFRRSLSFHGSSSKHDSSSDIPSIDGPTPTVEVLPEFGLTKEQFELEPEKQASFLSEQQNYIKDTINHLSASRDKLDDDDESTEAQSLDRKLLHYKFQGDKLDRELENVIKRMHHSEEFKNRENTTPKVEVLSPALANRPTFQKLDGVRLEQVKAQVSSHESHGLKLSYNVGDIITVVEKFPTGWWKGELNGIIAYFQEENTRPYGSSTTSPDIGITQTKQVNENNTSSKYLNETTSSFTEERKDEIVDNSITYDDSFEYDEPEDEEIEEEKQIVLVLYDFTSTSDTQTSISVGDKVELIKIVETWTYIIGPNGPGYVPTSYLQM